MQRGRQPRGMAARSNFKDPLRRDRKQRALCSSRNLRGPPPGNPRGGLAWPCDSTCTRNQQHVYDILSAAGILELPSSLSLTRNRQQHVSQAAGWPQRTPDRSQGDRRCEGGLPPNPRYFRTQPTLSLYWLSQNNLVFTKSASTRTSFAICCGSARALPDESAPGRGLQACRRHFSQSGADKA